MNGSAASGLMTIEGTEADPRLPVTALINDYITGYMGAIGAIAALVKRATEGGSWHVTVNLTRTAMWCGSLGLVDPALAGRGDAARASRAAALRRSESARRRPHARPAGALLAHLAVVAQPDPGPAGIQSRPVAISRITK